VRDSERPTGDLMRSYVRSFVDILYCAVLDYTMDGRMKTAATRGFAVSTL